MATIDVIYFLIFGVRYRENYTWLCKNRFCLF